MNPKGQEPTKDGMNSDCTSTLTLPLSQRRTLQKKLYSAAHAQQSLGIVRMNLDDASPQKFRAEQPTFRGVKPMPPAKKAEPPPQPPPQTMSARLASLLPWGKA